MPCPAGIAPEVRIDASQFASTAEAHGCDREKQTQPARLPDVVPGRGDALRNRNRGSDRRSQAQRPPGYAAGFMQLSGRSRLRDVPQRSREGFC